MKAIKITTSNRQMLGDRYQVEDYEAIFPVGYYVVAPFGTTDMDEEYYEGIVSESKLNELYIVGETLANGYFAITQK